MKIRLLRFFARRPLALVALGLATLLALIAAAGVSLVRPSVGPPLGERSPLSGGGAPAAGAESVAEGTQSSTLRRPRDDGPLDPRAILNRGWYDRYPRKRTEEVKFFIFFGGGFGIYEEGTAYKVAYELFELERQKDKLWLRFLQDGKTAESKFTITRCDEKSPFDLCLDIPDTPRGPKRFYGFDYYDDFAARIPWGPQMVLAAEAHAKLRE